MELEIQQTEYMRKTNFITPDFWHKLDHDVRYQVESSLHARQRDSPLNPPILHVKRPAPFAWRTRCIYQHILMERSE